MDAFRNLFMRRLAERINAVISEKTEGLVNRQSRAKDYAEYLARLEYITALREVVEWMAQVDSELSRDETPSPRTAFRNPPPPYRG